MVENSKHRLFFAVRISPEIEKKAIEILSELQKKALPRDVVVRWARPEQLHLTLKFIGPFEAARIPDLVASTQVLLAGFGAMNLVIGDTILFPNKHRPVVIAAFADDREGRFGALAALLDSELASFGIPRETREFRPHLTLGRIKSGKLSDGFPFGGALGQCQVGEVILFESKTYREGSVYREVARFAL